MSISEKVIPIDDYLSYDDMLRIPPPKWVCTCNHRLIRECYCQRFTIVYEGFLGGTLLFFFAGMFTYLGIWAKNGSNERSRTEANIETTLFAISGGCFIAMWLTVLFQTTLLNRFADRQLQKEFRANVQSACEEAGGEIHSKILNVFLLGRYIGAMRNNGLNRLDFEQTKLLYQSSEQQQFILNINWLNRKLRNIWSTVVKVHVLTEEQFAENLSKIQFREEFDNDEKLKEAIFECLPPQLQNSERVQIAIEKFKEQPLLLEPLPMPRGSENGSKEDKNNVKQIKFIVNNQHFAFYYENLVKNSPYFAEALRSVELTKSLLPGEEASFIPVNIPEEDQSDLVRLLEIIKEEKNHSTPAEMVSLYQTTKKYGFERSLRKLILETAPLSNYYEYLVFAYELEWEYLKTDLVSRLDKQVDSIIVDDLPEYLDEIRLIEIYRFANLHELSELGKTIIEKFISAFKNLNDIFQGIPEDFEDEVSFAFDYSASIEILIPELDQTEVSLLEIMLMHRLKTFVTILTKEQVKFLVDQFLIDGPSSMLNRALYSLFTQPLMLPIYDRVYSFIDPMPNRIRTLIKS